MPRSRTGEGRIAGRKEECQQWTKTLGRSHKRYLCHLGVTNIYPQLVPCHIVLYRNTSFKASFTGMNCQSPHDDLPAASSERFAITFPDVCKKKKGPAKFRPESLFWENGSWSTFLLVEEADTTTPLAPTPRSFPQTRHCPRAVCVRRIDSPCQECENNRGPFGGNVFFFFFKWRFQVACTSNNSNTALSDVLIIFLNSRKVKQACWGLLFMLHEEVRKGWEEFVPVRSYPLQCDFCIRRRRPAGDN